MSSGEPIGSVVAVCWDSRFWDFAAFRGGRGERQLCQKGTTASRCVLSYGEADQDWGHVDQRPFAETSHCVTHFLDHIAGNFDTNYG